MSALMRTGSSPARSTLAGAVVAMLLLGGCGGDEETEEAGSPRSAPAPEAAAAADDATIVIKDFTYAPVPLGVQAGTSITVKNDDGTAHTLTADDGSFDTGTIEGGASAEIEVTGSGRAEYHCEIHPSMKGAIETVGGGDAEQSEPEQAESEPAPGY